MLRGLAITTVVTHTFAEDAQLLTSADAIRLSGSQ